MLASYPELNVHYLKLKDSSRRRNVVNLVQLGIRHQNKTNTSGRFQPGINSHFKSGSLKAPKSIASQLLHEMGTTSHKHAAFSPPHSFSLVISG